MVESILLIRQMMADTKFSEAENQALTLVNQDKTPERREVLSIYLELLKQQKKSLPTSLLLELIEFEILHNIDQAYFWFLEVSQSEADRYKRQYQLINIQICEAKGRVDELYQLISNYQMYLFEKKVPAVPNLINDFVHKYFKKDFHLNLQRLSLTLVLYDLKSSEEILKELILSSIEKASPKGVKEKLNLLIQVLEGNHNKGYLEVYRQLCSLMCDGIQDKKDYKKLAELVIYFDDFKFQAIILNFIHQSELLDMASEYSIEVRSNPKYDFVFFEKYFSHLKPYFVQPRLKKSDEEYALPEIDLELSDDIDESLASPHMADRLEEEAALINLFKFQNFSSDQLLEIAVSFLQSELPHVALKATELALMHDQDEKFFLKATYLKLTCLLLLADNRAALDIAIIAMTKAQTKDDILSFLYGQAEAYIRLSQYSDAKRVLKKIMSIDSDYRLTRERLEKLNEI